MADDLGDSGLASLQQGGKLPNNSRDCRVVGKVFPDSATTVTVNVYPENPSLSITLEWINNACEVVDTLAAVGTMTFQASAQYAGWHTLRIRNTTPNQAGQKCWVKVNYTAPQVVQTNVAKQKCACVQSGSSIPEQDAFEHRIYPNPTRDVVYIESLTEEPISDLYLYNISGQCLRQIHDENEPVASLSLAGLDRGMYVLQVGTGKGQVLYKLIKD